MRMGEAGLGQLWARPRLALSRPFAGEHALWHGRAPTSDGVRGFPLPNPPHKGEGAGLCPW